MRLPSQLRLLVNFLDFFVEFLDRDIELMDLPYLVDQFLLEAGYASGELFYFLQVRRSRGGDQLMHALIIRRSSRRAA